MERAQIDLTRLSMDQSNAIHFDEDLFLRGILIELYIFATLLCFPIATWSKSLEIQICQQFEEFGIFPGVLQSIAATIGRTHSLALN